MKMTGPWPARFSRSQGDKFRIKLGLLDSCKLVPSQFHEYGYLSLGQIKDLMNKINTASA